MDFSFPTPRAENAVKSLSLRAENVVKSPILLLTKNVRKSRRPPRGGAWPAGWPAGKP